MWDGDNPSRRNIHPDGPWMLWGIWLKGSVLLNLLLSGCPWALDVGGAVFAFNPRITGGPERGALAGWEWMGQKGISCVINERKRAFPKAADKIGEKMEMGFVLPRPESSGCFSSRGVGIDGSSCQESKFILRNPFLLLCVQHLPWLFLSVTPLCFCPFLSCCWAGKY